MRIFVQSKGQNESNQNPKITVRLLRAAAFFFVNMNMSVDWHLSIKGQRVVHHCNESCAIFHSEHQSNEIGEKRENKLANSEQQTQQTISDSFIIYSRILFLVGKKSAKMNQIMHTMCGIVSHSTLQLLQLNCIQIKKGTKSMCERFFLSLFSCN